MSSVRMQKASETTDLRLVCAAAKLCGRCVNRLLPERPSLSAVHEAEVAAATAWVEVIKGLRDGNLRGAESRWRGYQNIIRALRNYRIDFDTSRVRSNYDDEFGVHDDSSREISGPGS